MLFNSLEFLIFFIIVYLLYRVSGHRFQNRMLLLASYFFYGCWDWRFLGLIWLSTVVDYLCGLKLHSSNDPARRRLFLAISLITNLGILAFFKYFNFFAESLGGLFGFFGFELDYVTLNIILPVGISFYTFQTMSYTIDIYRKQLEPARDFFDFALFVAFFPQLVAGPIERARQLLPQITAPRIVTDDQVYKGLWLILWGLFKKVFIADNLARIVDLVFASSGDLSGGAVLFASYAFAFQIYGDFSGYSDIARGISKLMGIEIMVNFRFPYFVTNPRDFWRNWHISLSTWLRDYLYIPLGGSRSGSSAFYKNLMITMILGGLWHGAAWTFVIWGLFHGIILCLHRVIEPYISFSPAGLFGRLWFFLRVIFFFHVTCLGWLIFRAGSMSELKQMLYALLSDISFSGVTLRYLGLQVAFYAALLIVVQIYKFYKKDMYAVLWLPRYLRWPLFLVIIYSILLFGEFGVQQFIYFQF